MSIPSRLRLQRRVFVLNGSNLNLLGTREPHLYGTATLDDVRQLCERTCEQLELALVFMQSNAQSDLIDQVHQAHAQRSAVVINAGAYARTSLALHDAVKAVQVPVIEIHITNIYQRDAYRPPSYLSRVVRGSLCGLGIDVYRLGLMSAATLLDADASSEEDHAIR